jgi:hypothetical protein
MTGLTKVEHLCHFTEVGWTTRPSRRFSGSEFRPTGILQISTGVPVGLHLKETGSCQRVRAQLRRK